MCLRDCACESGGVEAGEVSWELWIGRIGIVVSLPVFVAGLSSAKMDLHIGTASAVPLGCLL